jgi:hypothetical protein
MFLRTRVSGTLPPSRNCHQLGKAPTVPLGWNRLAGVHLQTAVPVPHACTCDSRTCGGQPHCTVGLLLPLLSTVRGYLLNLTFKYTSFLPSFTSGFGPSFVGRRLPGSLWSPLVACSLLCPPIVSYVRPGSATVRRSPTAIARTHARGAGGPD